MATKTSSKTATRKPAPKAFGAGRKTTAPQKPAEIVTKGKAPRKPAETPAEPAVPAGQRPAPAEKADVAAHPGSHPESVSLIDRKRPAKKSQQGEVKTKRAILPPISRIRASLEATAKASAPAQAPPPEPPPAESIEEAAVEATLTAAETESGPQQKVLLIKPPIVVKHFATELGLKPHQLIAELMTHNVFAN